MTKWSGSHRVFAKAAKSKHFIAVDRHTYVDFYLGEKGLMMGHAPDAIVVGIRE